MESTNLNEEEYEHQLETHHHAWRPPTFLLNDNNIHASCEEETRANSMIQNMGNFAWANPNINLIDDQQTLISSNKMIIKQESSSISSFHPRNSSPSTFPTEILNPASTELLLLNTLSPNYKHPAILANRELQHQGHVTTNFSQIFPTVNISNFGANNNNRNHGNDNNESSNVSELVSSHELDAFATERLINEGNLIAPSNRHMLELFKLENHHHHHHQLEQQSSDVKLWNKANNPSSFDNNGVMESNRPGCTEEPMLTQDRQMVSKKSRFESRSSCPPFKVRKEKLGDRIAALQQLVAPFGKTDTASVLMEAIGYIKFLQDQVETLSVPYMKLSTTRNTLRTKISDEDSEINGDEEKGELRSRGLCLVPASCMTYVAGDACNGGLWPPPNYHPGF